ncbi:hypothetical protein AM593_01113, partial [Mytilus galloprovincialis]
LKGCDPQIKDSLRKELEKQTRQWLAVRQSKNIPKDIVDTYAEMTLEIITRGKTKHATEFTEFKSKEHQMAPDDVKLLMTGQHKASEVDKEYAKDPHLFKGMIDIVIGKTKRWAVDSGGQILVSDQSDKWQVDDTQPERVKFAKVYANLWNDQVFATDVNANVYSKLSQKEWSQDKQGSCRLGKTDNEELMQ